jgi:hypothetical protein
MRKSSENDIDELLAMLDVDTAMHKKSTTLHQQATNTSMPSSAPLKVKKVHYWKGAKPRSGVQLIASSSRSLSELTGSDTQG